MTMTPARSATTTSASNAAASTVPAAASARPLQISLAVILRVATVLLNFLGPLLPGADDLPAEAIVVTGVITVVMLVGAKALWDLRRWGLILTVILTSLSVLSSIPALLAASSGWFVTVVILATACEMAIIGLLLHPAARRAVRS